jgi:transcriptional regulator with XRE-family HTH domain
VPVVGDAVVQGDYGTVFRTARVAAGLTLQQVGRRAGYSAATLSRLEGGRRRVRDLDELRHWAVVYDIPPHVFGLAAQPGDPNGSTLSGNPDGEGEQVQRRNFVTAMAAAGVVATLPAKPATASSSGSSTLDDVLFGRVLAVPASAQHLATQVAAARDDLRATR